jgi:uncharacterized damage-inducible protein DinB
MNRRLGPLFEILRLNTRLFVNVLDGVDVITMEKRPGDGGNSMGFIACHVLDARCYLARQLGLEPDNPYQEQFDAATGIDDFGEYPPVTGLCSVWVEVSGQLEQRFELLSDEELRKESTQAFPVEDKSVLGVVAFLLQHESFHIGQLALLRRQHGMGAMSHEN